MAPSSQELEPPANPERFTPEGEVRYVNKGAREFLGYSEEELLSMPKGCLAALEPVNILLQKKGN